jgi:CheY-like chemotaxis protein
MSTASPLPLHILLADDDTDDSLLFKDALDEMSLSVNLTTVAHGEELMQWLDNIEQLPDLIFLDLNMPRKNGFDCLLEIKQSEKLKHLSVIIFSTSFEGNVIDLLYKNGAQHYICKPNEFSQLVKVIYYAITTSSHVNLAQPRREEFVLSPESCSHESK